MIIKENIEEFQSYLVDAGNLHGIASKLFIPENIEELIEIVKQCYNSNQNITISGAGTGTTGGRVAMDGIIISTEKLNKIIDFDEENMLIEVESGVTLNQLYDFLSDKNCFYAPNPTESNSTIGGNISNNSSGARTFKYGPTRNFVEELEIILSNGDVLNIKRGQQSSFDLYEIISKNGNIYNFEIPEINYPNTKNSTGFFLKKNMDLIDLFIGNEGTLGIISKAKLKLNNKPENVLGFMIFFDNIANCLKFVDEIREMKDENQQKLCRLIEFFDRNSLNLINLNNNVIPILAQSAIWIEIECLESNSDIIVEQLFDLINDYSNLSDDTILAQNEKEHKFLANIRHSLPLAVNDIVSKSGFRKIGTDTAIPKEFFNDFYYFMEEIFSDSKIEYVIFGHIGDCHLHGNLFPKNEDEFKKALEIYIQIINKTLEFNGSISAEHGIGKIKKQYFEMMLGKDNIEKMKIIKKVFDEKWLLGIGNLF